MNKNFRVLIISICLLAAPGLSLATTFFTDDFSHGSTTNGPSIPGGTPTASFTSYDLASTKNGNTSVMIANDFTLKLAAATTAGWVESQALFSTNPVSLTAINDYIELTFVFTNTAASLFAGGNTSLLWVGLLRKEECAADARAAVQAIADSQNVGGSEGESQEHGVLASGSQGDTHRRVGAKDGASGINVSTAARVVADQFLVG